MVLRGLLLILLVTACGCAPSPPDDSNRSAGSTVNAPSHQAPCDAADAHVLAAVLEHLAIAEHEFVAGKPQISVLASSNGPSAYIAAHLVAAELGAQEAGQIQDLLPSLNARNQAVSGLPEICCPGATLLTPASPPPVFTRDLHVGFWLPGYSHDCQRAVVRLSLSPTPHGATATYYLQRRASAWLVVWHEFSYYA